MTAGRAPSTTTGGHASWLPKRSPPPRFTRPVRRPEVITALYSSACLILIGFLLGVHFADCQAERERQVQPPQRLEGSELTVLNLP